jgi:hypothetical protein
MTEGIGVALDAMRSDASKWQTAAGDLNKPLSTIGSLKLTPADVSMWAADRGLDKTYDEARSALENMIRQAAQYFGKLSTDLQTAASQYERDDQRGMHELQRSAE